MIDGRFKDLLTVNVHVYGIFDPIPLEVHDLDAEIDLPLDDVIGISRYSIEGREIFVICANARKRIVSDCDGDDQPVIYLVTDERTYLLMHELVG